MTTTTHDTTDNYRTSSVLSLNINGMSEDKKRHKLFETLINKNIDIRHILYPRNILNKKFDM